MARRRIVLVAFPDVQILDCSSTIQDQIMSELHRLAHSIGLK